MREVAAGTLTSRRGLSGRQTMVLTLLTCPLVEQPTQTQATSLCSTRSTLVCWWLLLPVTAKRMEIRSRTRPLTTMCLGLVRLTRPTTLPASPTRALTLTLWQAGCRFCLPHHLVTTGSFLGHPWQPLTWPGSLLWFWQKHAKLPLVPLGVAPKRRYAPLLLI
jgi:hypothetical protein